MKFVATLVAASVIATPVLSETYRCIRTSLSTNGFSNSGVAESWFPKVVEFNVRGNSVSSNYYGDGKVKDKGGRLYFEFFNDGDGSADSTVIYTYIKKNGRFSGRLAGKAGYQTVNGSRGKCTIS